MWNCKCLPFGGQVLNRAITKRLSINGLHDQFIEPRLRLFQVSRVSNPSVNQPYTEASSSRVFCGLP